MPLAKRGFRARFMEDSTQPPQSDLYKAVHDVPMPPSIKVFGILQIVLARWAVCAVVQEED